MKKIILLLSLTLMSCIDYKNETDARKVKVGMTVNELKYIMGEPEDIDIKNGYEELSFYYEYNNRRKYLEVTIMNNKIYDFYSY